MDDGHAPVLAAAAHSGALARGEVVSNAAVALFGGIETAEGMICNAALPLLGNAAGSDLDRGVEESLRLEPAAAVVDRYATRDVTASGALIGRGDLVRVSITGANRDPAVFPSPDRFDPARPNAGRHLAFARGPHFCAGAHLARLETVTALRALLAALPGIRLDASRPARVRGLVFRKPPALHAAWD
jgi:cytochrome P450